MGDFGVCRSPPLWAVSGFVGAHPCGQFRGLWEPTPWAMGVAHALNFPLQTIAHGVGSCKKPFLESFSRLQGAGSMKLDRAKPCKDVAALGHKEIAISHIHHMRRGGRAGPTQHAVVVPPGR